jgi:succinyl-diaminopimelate desuccinylase
MDGKNPVILAQKLIQCPSVTPLEAGALSFLEEILGSAGFQTKRLVFSSPNTPDVDNVYARIGTEAPVLLFAGHTDVVPPGDLSLWRHDPFSGKVEDGILYGRGACDMKGGVACMVAAALRWLEKKRGENTSWGSIAFLITGDEEAEAINGTQRVLTWAGEHSEHFDACLVGEPSSVAYIGDRIKVGRRGSLTGVITAHGQQGHVAYPHKAQNPIPALMELIRSLLETPLDSGSTHFEPSNLEFTSVDVGNSATNVIPGAAQATFNVRFNDCWTLKALQEEIARRLARTQTSLSYTLDFSPHVADVFVPLASSSHFIDQMVQAVNTKTGRTPELSTNGGTSDARFIKNYCPVIELGLCGETMHKVNERVPLEDLETLTALYEHILSIFFKAHKGQ